MLRNEEGQAFVPGQPTTIKYTSIASEGVKYLTVSEFAKRINVSSASVRRQCERGDVPGAFKFGSMWRIPVREIDYGSK